MEAIFKRASVRRFKEEQVEEAKIEKILRAAMQAPSAGNQQPWEFIVVRNKETLFKLSNMGPYSGFIKEAPVAIVILGNQKRMKYPENWMQDLGAATQNILLEVTELGLGAVWATAAPLEDRMKVVTKLFNLPEYIMPYGVIPIGYPVTEPKVTDRFDEDRIYRESYGMQIEEL